MNPIEVIIRHGCSYTAFVFVSYMKFQSFVREASQKSRSMDSVGPVIILVMELKLGYIHVGKFVLPPVRALKLMTQTRVRFGWFNQGYYRMGWVTLLF